MYTTMHNVHFTAQCRYTMLHIVHSTELPNKPLSALALAINSTSLYCIALQSLKIKCSWALRVGINNFYVIRHLGLT